MAFEGLTEKISATFKKLRGKGRLKEADVKEAMREIRMALLEADVSYKVSAAPAIPVAVVCVCRAEREVEKRLGESPLGPYGAFDVFPEVLGQRRDLRDKNREYPDAKGNDKHHAEYNDCRIDISLPLFVPHDFIDPLHFFSFLRFYQNSVPMDFMIS